MRELRERWVSPPTVPREAARPEAAVWRFRLAALVLLGLFVYLLFLVFQQVSGANDQDPGLDARSRVATVARA